MEISMQAAMNKRLSRIIGMKVQDFYRAGDMPRIAFEGQGQSFHLHAQCPVRLTDENRILIGVNDMYIPGSEADEGTFDSDHGDNSLYDESAKAFLAEGGHRVIAASVSIYGDVRVKLTGGYELTAAPCGTSHCEEWRFFEQGAEKHSVYYGDGVLEEEQRTGGDAPSTSRATRG